MSSKKELNEKVNAIMNVIKLHEETFKEKPIQKGYILSFKKGFPIVFIKVNQLELTELNKRLENEK